VKQVTKLVTFHVPKDPALLAAFGEVALRHEHMNYELRLIIKSLAGVTVAEAIAATRYESSRQLRDRARKLARKRLGEGAQLIKLEAILASCRALTERRNELVHGLWAKGINGEAQIRSAFGDPRALPSVEELRGLAREIEAVTKQMNIDRLRGWLHEALSRQRSRTR
jgi:hypothetical protein